VFANVAWQTYAPPLPREEIDSNSRKDQSWTVLRLEISDESSWGNYFHLICGRVVRQATGHFQRVMSDARKRLREGQTINPDAHHLFFRE
jgi:hypothetical protein